MRADYLTVGIENLMKITTVLLVLKIHFGLTYMTTSKGFYINTQLNGVCHLLKNDGALHIDRVV